MLVKKGELNETPCLTPLLDWDFFPWGTPFNKMEKVVDFKIFFSYPINPQLPIPLHIRISRITLYSVLPKCLLKIKLECNHLFLGFYSNICIQKAMLGKINIIYPLLKNIATFLVEIWAFWLVVYDGGSNWGLLWE